MTIRRNYGNTDSPRDRLLRKMDQHMEMASMAMSDNDRADYTRHMGIVQQLKEEIAQL